MKNFNILFLIAALISAPVLLANGNLAEQLKLVKDYVKNINHPRLILGVANLESSNALLGENPFLNNPSDILADINQDPEALKGRTLTFDFNNMAELSQLSEALKDTFDIITADFLVTKYASFGKEHLAYFKKMLKPNGTLFLPVDQQALETSLIKAKTKDELYKLAAKESGLENDLLKIKHTGVGFAYLPEEMRTKIQVSPEEIDEQFLLYKKLAPDFDYATIQNDRAATRIKREKVQKLARELGIKENPMNFPEEIKSGQKKLLDDEEKLKNFIKQSLMRNKQAPIKNDLKNEFMVKYIIPYNLKRITADIFDPNKIIIANNLSLPQPHRKATYEGYAISATK
jgi:hypothetical protein